MSIHIPTIEEKIRNELVYATKDIEYVVQSVRDAVSNHILHSGLAPHGFFHMRLFPVKKCGKIDTPPCEQTYLVVYFGADQPDPDYIAFIRGYYGNVIFLHFQHHQSLCF